MNIEQVNEILAFLEGNSSVQNYIAQAKSRYILYNVEEPEDNFPNYVSNLSERNNHTAFSYLTVGCYLAEQDNLREALHPLKMGASILEYNHKPKDNRITNSKYYLLACSLAYYGAFEYSKAFVVLKEVEYDTIAGNLLGLFLKKRFENLLIAINNVLLNSDFSQPIINNQDVPSDETDTKIYNYLLAKSLANLLEYFYGGNEESLQNSKVILSDLLELLEVDEEPSLWWCIRLFRIIIFGFDKSAVWKILPPLFPEEKSKEIAKFVKTLSLRTTVPVIELFISQREAISKALNSKGLVVCLPTSGGKTRIAEISIFQALIESEDSIVVYIAPFRSLAFEVEQTLETTFEKLGYGVSHLYGGSQFSKIDRLQIENSRILIATPEKAKALIRADETIAKRIKLIVIDEGHLIGNDNRLIRNEMFFEELRHHIEENEGKFIVLSAVLPNAADIAEWLTQSKENVYANDWKPSTRRLGTLEYTGGNVNINWLKEDPETWNYRFITPLKNEEGKTFFPISKRQAIAATAVKLAKNGSVLIFHARGTEINSQAEECLTAMGNNLEIHKWKNLSAWKAFELATKQSLGDDSVLLKFAQYGILCHQRKLPNNVKLSLERLMRQSNPKIIISTTTLAQGVNLGVSSVIIANIWFDYPGGNGLSQSIFWNIVGRAGRAFIDSEGKVLFAIDQTHGDFRVNKREKNTAHRFLLSENHDNAFSGIILMILELEKIASKYDVNFELLLELISENYEEVETPISEIEFNELQNKLDLIDDTLLSLNDKKMSWLNEDSSEWIDNFFRKSLAYIQSENHENIDGTNLIRYLKKRNNIILKKAGDHTKWKEHINTGIPLRSSIKLNEILINFENLFNQFQESDKSFASLIDVLAKIEEQVDSLPGEDFKRKDRIGNSDITSQNRVNAKTLWLNGTPYSEIEESIGKQKASYFCNDFFSFTLPWATNAIARKFNRIEKEDVGEFYEDLSVILEIGVPNIQSAKVYLAGFRSRKVALEIAGLVSFSMDELTLSEIREEILVLREQLLPNLSIDSIGWFDLLEEEKESNNHMVTKIPNFVFKSGRTYPIEKLIPRLYEGKTYLCTPDLSKKILLSYDSDIFPFEELVNKPGIYFENRGNVWCHVH
jgi:hypothetical protein